MSGIFLHHIVARGSTCGVFDGFVKCLVDTVVMNMAVEILPTRTSKDNKSFFIPCSNDPCFFGAHYFFVSQCMQN